ncbi:DUF2085 domain-containing protein [Chloroflexus sp.]|uniref:DUF2085 domain-containing protein n=1 Tax=Chloroflexus sp. TaxID=1904827 RepID=UPI00262281C8|nr:DUF2085 domain-containing protein [uncultured Chloroflexus sp.]
MKLPISQRSVKWSKIAYAVGIVATLVGLPAIAAMLDLERRLFFAVHGICAQTHNLVSGGVQFPLCARDSGIYLGLMVTLAVIAALGRMRAGRLPSLPISLLLIGLIVLMGIDGLNSTVAELGLTPVYQPRDELRLLTGLGFGVALATGLLLIANHTLLPPDLLLTDQAPIEDRRDLIVIAGAQGLVALAIAADQPILAWPLVLFSVIGITGVMTFAIMIPVITFTGLANRVRHPSQLRWPALISFLVALFLLAGLAIWRVYLEGSGFLPPPLIPE